MTKQVLASYHCCFLLSGDNANLLMGIVWRRVGRCDYGIYLTRSPFGSEQLGALITVFRALYNDRGQIISFLVKDGWQSNNEVWDDEHVSQKTVVKHLLMDDDDKERVNQLGDVFCNDWLETYAETEAIALLKGLGLRKLSTKSDFMKIIGSGLPLEIKKDCLPDVLAEGEATDNGHIYCFMPFSVRGSSSEQYNESASLLLEGKMRSFFELL